MPKGYISRADPDSWMGLKHEEERTLNLVVKYGCFEPARKQLKVSLSTMTDRFRNIRRKLGVQTTLAACLKYQEYRQSQGIPTKLEPEPYRYEDN